MCSFLSSDSSRFTLYALLEKMASLYILLAIFLWSSLGIVVRPSGVEIHVLIFYSLIVSLIVQGLILLQKRYRKEIPKFKQIKYPLILGIFSLLNTFDRPLSPEGLKSSCLADRAGYWPALSGRESLRSINPLREHVVFNPPCKYR
jgi:hypothetical protein